MIQVSLALDDLFTDPSGRTIIMVLRDKVSGSAFPIWIGPQEANAILFELQGIETPRPMTHDLAKNLLVNNGIVLKRAVLTKLEDYVYYAELVTEKDGQETVTDSRPSDAIALALRFGAPILATDDFWAMMVSMPDNQRVIEDLERVRRNRAEGKNPPDA